MFSLKKAIFACLLSSIFIQCSIDAALNYQQVVTLTSFDSQEEVKQMALSFEKAAKGDPDIKIINIQYETKKETENSTFFIANITCHVSKVNEDVLRISGKIAPQ